MSAIAAMRRPPYIRAALFVRPMEPPMIRLCLAAAAAVCLLSPAAARDTAPVAEGAWARLPAATGRPAAAYFTLKGGSKPDVLVGASSPGAERVEMHSMTMRDGVMRMRAETAFAVPAGGTVAFKPGGNHLMLFGLQPMKAGETLPITLQFKSGATQQLMAETRSAGSAPAAPGHQH